jgi:hypothetical protein
VVGCAYRIGYEVSGTVKTIPVFLQLLERRYVSVIPTLARWTWYAGRPMARSPT